MKKTAFRNPEAISNTGDSIDFSFGENWQKYVTKIDEPRIVDAEASFRKFTGVESLKGHTFLDVGCGSGLNSLIAHRMGAERIVSLDVDPNSVAATTYLKSQFAEEANWEIREQSALDGKAIAELGTFSYVLSWGVLHHTGDMWTAVENVAKYVKEDGKLHLALYHHCPAAPTWLKIKRAYNRTPQFLKPAVRGAYAFSTTLRRWLKLRFRSQGRSRGMDYWRDVEDWLGGLPYEYCRPEELIHRLDAKDFRLRKLRTVNGHGCNEFLFELQA